MIIKVKQLVCLKIEKDGKNNKSSFFYYFILVETHWENKNLNIELIKIF